MNHMRKEDRDMKKNDLHKLFTFIDESPTSFHAVANLEKMLDKQGFVRLHEKDTWKLEKGRKYYVNRNGSSLMAFTLPSTKSLGFRMVAAHSDSPCFKLKESPEIAADPYYLKLNVEKYGGMILSTWLDRPLSVAGRIVVKDGDGLRSCLVNLDRDTAIIPNLAIHMNQDMNKGVEYNPQTDMQPIIGEASCKGSFMKQIAKEAGVKGKDILGSDLFLYNRDKCRLLGEDDAFIAGPRLDDLECAYAGMATLADCAPENYVNLCVVFDNEEVGSGTKQGAASTFLKDVLERICCGLTISREEYLRMIADSFLISADNAHALHPNHPGKADETNRPMLNGGIVIKYHGSQKYATDAYSAAVMKDLCNRADVPYQTYANRSDIPGGSTLGNIAMSQVSVSTVDIGLPQLAMHSALETAGAKDPEYLIKALRTFFQ